MCGRMNNLVEFNINLKQDTIDELFINKILGNIKPIVNVNMKLTLTAINSDNLKFFEVISVKYNAFDLEL